MRTVYWERLDEATRQALLARPALRAPVDVGPILDAVRTRGDAAVRELTERFDGIQLESLRIPYSDIESAGDRLTADQRAALEQARNTLMAFHDAGRTRPYSVETIPGVRCGREVRPIQAVGLYVPGGTAPLPSTALMLGVPAELAGSPVRILCTPPGPGGAVDPGILYAAWLCGIRSVFRIGGAQAIAAMAYGTESVPRVDKLFGPGNAWVTAAKSAVANDTGGARIDMPAGPSELMVVADARAEPEFIAADLLSQAEHGPDSQVFLVTDAPAIAAAVVEAVARQLTALPRREIAAQALDASRIILVPEIADATNIVNDYAPEHLILALADPEAFLGRVRHAGSVFLGDWTPETLGDYCSGTNHVLPTYGYARTLSGLAVSDFETRMTVQRAEPHGLAALGPVAETLAAMEGLDAHANAVKVRRVRL